MNKHQKNKARKQMRNMSIDSLVKTYKQDDTALSKAMQIKHILAGQELVRRASSSLNDIVRTFEQANAPLPNYSARIRAIETPQDAISFYNMPVYDEKTSLKYIKDLGKAFEQMGFTDTEDIMRVIAENEDELRQLAEERGNSYNSELYEMAQIIIDNPEKYSYHGDNTKMIARVLQFDEEYVSEPAINGGFWGF